MFCNSNGANARGQGMGDSGLGTETGGQTDSPGLAGLLLDAFDDKVSRLRRGRCCWWWGQRWWPLINLPRTGRWARVKCSLIRNGFAVTQAVTSSLVDAGVCMCVECRRASGRENELDLWNGRVWAATLLRNSHLMGKGQIEQQRLKGLDLTCTPSSLSLTFLFRPSPPSVPCPPLRTAFAHAAWRNQFPFSSQPANAAQTSESNSSIADQRGPPCVFPPNWFLAFATQS